MERLDFIDILDIYVKAGDGGNGAVTFRREKYIPFGGPDGGDGGDGGYVFIIADPTLSTLYHLSEKRKYRAGNAEHGRSRKQNGKNGEDLILRVPVGTIVKDYDTGEILADLDEPGKYCCVARGGKGGRGNTHFKSSTNQTPKFAEQGSKGEEKHILLELKLLADAGLIGYPNVGKSSIISKISNARPKIANYHFTTLVPNLGVVSIDNTPETSFVVADIPGLIKGASEGKGLGNVFLKHVERCSVIVHVVDIAGSEGRDPVQDYFDIRKELEFFSKDLYKKEELVVGNKVDLLSEEELEERKKLFFEKTGKIVFPISAVTGFGIEKLKYAIWNIVRKSKKMYMGVLDLSKIEFVKPTPVKLVLPEKVDITILKEDDGFVVESNYVKKYIEKYKMEAKYLLDDILEILQKNGLDEKLKKAGAKDGDTIWVEGVEFVFKE